MRIELSRHQALLLSECAELYGRVGTGQPEGLLEFLPGPLVNGVRAEVLELLRLITSKLSGSPYRSLAADDSRVASSAREALDLHADLLVALELAAPGSPRLQSDTPLVRLD